MLRFFAEIIWFPSAALSSYLQWQPIDDERAHVTMRDAGHTVNAEFSFDAQGRMTGMRAERYFGGGADSKLTPWLARCDRWATVRGVQLPTHGEVLWALPAGEFSYYRWEIMDVETNRPELYGPHERARSLASDS